MKKQYEAPKAEKFEFNYRENVVASGEEDIENVKFYPNINPCNTGNGANMNVTGTCGSNSLGKQPNGTCN